MTKSEISIGLRRLNVVYKAEITDDLIDVYYLVLYYFEKDRYEKAIDSILDSRTYTTMPNPATIKEIILSHTSQKRLPPPVEPAMTETEMLFFNMNIRFCAKLIREGRSKQWNERERDMFLMENSDGVFNSKTIAECVRLSNSYPDVPKCDPRNEYSGDVKNLIKTIMGKRMEQ